MRITTVLDKPALMSADLPTYDQCLGAEYHLSEAGKQAAIAHYTRDPFHAAKVKQHFEKAAAALGYQLTPIDGRNDTGGMDMREPMKECA